MAVTPRPRPRPPIEVHATPTQPLGMSPAAFLRDYWQKHPLLIRSAFPDFQLPLEPDELAGLACEELALSRLIVRDPEHDRWQVHNGPFDETTFARLPEDHWTLLVQDVDKWDADVAALLSTVDFLPSWRVDDIMISYAEDGGGVGAHVDQYDVFLIQGLGRRRWSIDARKQPPLGFRDDVELKLLERFDASHSWVLEPGDVLYLPPGVPHDGVAEGPCMTFSIGMRAPSSAELLLDFSETVAERLPESIRYADPDLSPARRRGEIDRAALDRVAAALGPLAAAMTRAQLGDWFGRFITRYRSAQLAAPPQRRTTAASLTPGRSLVRHPWTRLAWLRRGRQATLFVAGHAHACSPDLAQSLCGPGPSPVDPQWHDADRMMVLALINDGHFALTRGRR